MVKEIGKLRRAGSTAPALSRADAEKKRKVLCRVNMDNVPPRTKIAKSQALAR